jgi:protein-S-isoprenylcysteine O-methyltransferase Ste14
MFEKPFRLCYGAKSTRPITTPKKIYFYFYFKKIKEEEEERTLDAYTTTNYYKYQKLIPYTLPRQYCLWHSSL